MLILDSNVRIGHGGILRAVTAISGDPLIGDLRRAGLLSLLVLHYIAREQSYGNRLIERIGRSIAAIRAEVL
jgi:hypothetical protein